MNANVNIITLADDLTVLVSADNRNKLITDTEDMLNLLMVRKEKDGILQGEIDNGSPNR